MSERFQLSGRTALVTGGAKRLGRAVCEALAAHGTRIVVHYRESEFEAEDLAARIRDAGAEAWTVSADLDELGAAEQLFDEARSVAGAIDILINSASIFPSDALADVSWESLTANARVNAYAPFELSRKLVDQGMEGCIVNFLDTRIQDYDEAHVSYHVSKRILHKMARLCAEAYAPKVRVNAVAPGLVLPPAGKDEAYLEGLKHSNPLNSFGNEQDIADAVVYLLQARFVTGQILYVDGGRHMRGGLYG